MSGLREGLLAVVAASHEMDRTLAAAGEAAPPAEPDGWTARDHVAHVAHYYAHAADVLDAVRTGSPVPADPEEELDERNARVYEASRSLSAGEVEARLRASHERLVDALGRCSDEDLAKPFTPSRDVPVNRLVLGCSLGHVAQHLQYWHEAHGDAGAAEAAARRAYEVQVASFEDPDVRAAATYNLGCYYATSGRPDEALALVNEALAAAPDLREWAGQDPDLESIRDRLPAATPG